MHLTCNGSDRNCSPHCPAPPPPLPCYNALLLLRVRGKGQTVRNANCFYVSFSWPNIWAISAEAPKLQPPLFPVLLDYWFYLVPGQSLWGIWILHPLQAEVRSPLTYGGWGGRGLRRGAVRDQSSKPIWAFPQVTHCCQDTSQLGPGRPGHCPAS